MSVSCCPNTTNVGHFGFIAGMPFRISLTTAPDSSRQRFQAKSISAGELSGMAATVSSLGPFAHRMISGAFSATVPRRTSLGRVEFTSTIASGASVSAALRASMPPMLAPMITSLPPSRLHQDLTWAK